MKYNKQTKEKAKKKQKPVGKSSYHITQNITQNTHLMLYQHVHVLCILI